MNVGALSVLSNNLEVTAVQNAPYQALVHDDDDDDEFAIANSGLVLFDSESRTHRS